MARPKLRPGERGPTPVKGRPVHYGTAPVALHQVRSIRLVSDMTPRQPAEIIVSGSGAPWRVTDATLRWRQDATVEALHQALGQRRSRRDGR